MQGVTLGDVAHETTGAVLDVQQPLRKAVVEEGFLPRAVLNQKRKQLMHV